MDCSFYGISTIGFEYIPLRPLLECGSNMRLVVKGRHRNSLESCSGKTLNRGLIRHDYITEDHDRVTVRQFRQHL